MLPSRQGHRRPVRGKLQGARVVGGVRRSFFMRVFGLVTAIGIAITGGGLALAGCSGSSTNNNSNSSNSGTPPTFKADVYPIISANCLACHVPGQIGVTEGMLDMSTEMLAYMDLFEAPAAGSECGGTPADGGAGRTRVIASNPAMSLLYEKITSPPCGSRMPLNAAALPQSSINTIHDWIAGGAMP
jgi:hypothetical protein